MDKSTNNKNNLIYNRLAQLRFQAILQNIEKSLHILNRKSINNIFENKDAIGIINHIFIAHPNSKIAYIFRKLNIIVSWFFVAFLNFHFKIFYKQHFLINKPNCFCNVMFEY